MRDAPEYADAIDDIQHYTGADGCHYGCGSPGAFVVQARGVDGRTYTFCGCRECLNDARIYPIKNGHVDALELEGEYR
ncbi:hypothetical protein PM085_15695 [Halorubrum ezzemoulense]|uniref:CENP-V/GFA domain-containing protein n=1 Tax=Halorubrum ezzemoulense TaxID=337243 RepID=A0ABT4Z6K1_HALEZ|nr:hypothetical protein [Halorubrum ezzemoulense]MDB2293700.1 hypothetical protein [Halorubrum ezzemoulense]